MPDVAATASDQRMMERCIALSRTAGEHGEFPFACVICCGDEVVAETVNRVARDQDITRHAEMVAISAAQRTLGTIRLRNCSLYTNVEPCAMCSWAIREAGIGRVVFAIESPVMGGLTRWKLLDDQRLSEVMPFFFRRAPDLVGGLLACEAEKVWSDWHPLLWRIIRRRGCLGSPPPQIAVIPDPGRALEVSVKVSDAMTPAVISVTPTATILDAARLMLENHVSGLPVVDGRGSLVGMISEKDLLRRPEIGTERQRSRWLDALLGPAEAAAAYVQSHGMKVGEVMTTTVVSVGHEATLDQAVQLMETHDVKRLPVVDQDRVIGIISRADLLRALLGVFSSLSPSLQEDAAMRERILQDIGKQSWSAGALVDVVIRNGVAVLWGSISDMAQRQALKVLVESTSGVNMVEDRLTLRGGPPVQLPRD